MSMSAAAGGLGGWLGLPLKQQVGVDVVPSRHHRDRGSGCSIDLTIDCNSLDFDNILGQIGADHLVAFFYARRHVESAGLTARLEISSSSSATGILVSGGLSICALTLRAQQIGNVRSTVEVPWALGKAVTAQNLLSGTR